MKLIKDLGLKYKKTRNGITKKKYRYGLFFCEYCQKQVEKRIDHGLSVKSCGCVASKLCLETKRKNGQLHGQTKTRLYRIWAGMKHRCCPSAKGEARKIYYGRGILICEEWKNNFLSFKKWAEKNGYDEHLEIDRKDNNGPYSPENCRFVTRVVNSRNRNYSRTNPQIIKEIKRRYFSDGFSQKDLASLYNIDQSCISRIINNKKPYTI